MSETRRIGEVVHAQSKNVVAARVSVLASAGQRMRGLMGGSPANRGAYAVLAPCRDIHTYGMDCAIDVAFVDATGVVVAAFRGVPPRKRLRKRRACLVAERLASEKPWFREGDALFVLPGGMGGVSAASGSGSATLAEKERHSHSISRRGQGSGDLARRTYRIKPVRRKAL